MEWPQKGAGRESLRFPLLSSVAQEAGHSPVGGDDDEEVPPLRRGIHHQVPHTETVRHVPNRRFSGEAEESQ